MTRSSLRTNGAAAAQQRARRYQQVLCTRRRSVEADEVLPSLEARLQRSHDRKQLPMLGLCQFMTFEAFGVLLLEVPARATEHGKRVWVGSSCEALTVGWVEAVGTKRQLGCAVRKLCMRR